MMGVKWLGFLLLAGLAGVEGVEVCKVADLQLVTQTGEFFLAGQLRPPSLHAPIGLLGPVRFEKMTRHVCASAFSGGLLRADRCMRCAVTFLGLGLTSIIFVLMAFKASYEKRKVCSQATPSEHFFCADRLGTGDAEAHVSLPMIAPSMKHDEYNFF